METAFSNIQFIITPQHFHNGKMKIRCAAHIHDVYWQTTEKSIEEDRHVYGGSHGNTIDFSYDSESSDESNYITGLHIQGMLNFDFTILCFGNFIMCNCYWMEG